MSDLTEQVVNTAKKLEKTDNYTDFQERFDPLEVKATTTLGHDGVSDITVVVSIGGPHIEINVSNGTVSGVWGGDSHTTHFDNLSLCERLHAFYQDRFEMEA